MIEFFIFAMAIGMGIVMIKGHFSDKKILKKDAGVNDWIKF